MNCAGRPSRALLPAVLALAVSPVTTAAQTERKRDIVALAEILGVATLLGAGERFTS